MKSVGASKQARSLCPVYKFIQRTPYLKAKQDWNVYGPGTDSTAFLNSSLGS